MQKTQQELDNYYNTVEKCKASWKVKKIIKEDTYDGCSNFLKIRLNDGVKDYVVRWTEQKENATGSGCIQKVNTFLPGDVPNVWDEMYVVAKEYYTNILKLGSDIYNSNLSLPNCWIYSDDPLFWDDFIWADKCKVSWKIAEVKKTSADNCGFGLQFEVQNNESTYFFNGRESIYFEKYGSYCLWRGESWFPIVTYSQQWEASTYYPSKWDDIYAILDMSNNTILKYGVDNYNTNADVPVCVAETNPEKYSSVIWVSDIEVKTIMDKAETELKNLFNHEKVKSTADQALESPKEITVVTVPKTTPIHESTIPKKTTISTPPPKQEEKKEVKQVEVVVSTGSEVQEMVSTWSEIKEEKKEETVIIKPEPIKLSVYESFENYILFSWIVVLSIIVYFIFKKLKTKKV